MKDYIKHDPWKIIEDGFHPDYNRITESLCSLGNGTIGQRGNFEEQYSGDTLQGNYIAGVYYPDKTRVGWWKNGYPEYFAKVLNSPNWIGINIEIDNEPLDLATCEIENFTRVLNMQEGILERSFTAKLASGKIVNVDIKRFVSLVDTEIGVIRYAITPINFDGQIKFTPYVDADIANEDSNYDEKFWDEISQTATDGEAYVSVKTKKTDFHVCSGMTFDLFKNNQKVDCVAEPDEREKYVSNTIVTDAHKNEEVVFVKYAAILSSLNHKKDDLEKACQKTLEKAHQKGFDQLYQEHVKAWADKWIESDITIEGDVSAQQGIRFNIFQLNQTYTGKDERLNIGPKGFTGEKYGGTTYWDTEAYCLPFYLSTAEEQVAKNLLVYRYKHLAKAIENGENLGFKNGAALYPMVTINGEECHNEWEITFEEIHRNGAIAFAIYNYIRYTGDHAYLSEYGLEVLIGISRFWAQRVNWSEAKNKYVMLGVTGPNEYENNVNNNWYTSSMACWTMKYTLEALDKVKMSNPERYNAILKQTHFNAEEEQKQWQHILDNMFFPTNESLNIFLQQDGYMDKEQILVKDLDPSQRPINQHWSWDRILRSCFIKQADVLQGIYFLEDHYDDETIKRNYDFYEPRTVHESSLSPCVHSILAAKLGYHDKAYEFYLRTARLDLDDYNNDTEDGCHITSMAGTWLSIVQGFGGMRVKEDQLYFNPIVPKDWKSFSFKIRFRKHLLNITINKESIQIDNQSEEPIELMIRDKSYTIKGKDQLVV